jgi:hypothetical protein
MSMSIRKGLIGTAIAMALAGAAYSAEYSVGIVGLGSTYPYGGTGINLYTTTEKGAKLVKGSPFVYQPTLPPGEPFSIPAEPIAALVSGDQQFVYVAYAVFSGIPILVQFAITPTGLKPRWQQGLSTGDEGLDGSTLVGAGDYLMEKVYPDGLYIRILNASGQEVVAESNGGIQVLNSSHLDAQGRFYYSCRGGTFAATSVAIYDLESISGEPSKPFVVSTDPIFVQGNCPVMQLPPDPNPSG